MTLVALLLPGVASSPASGVASRSLFVAVDGSPGAPCTQTAPCGSFDRAYRVARPGDSILIAGGTYPSQLIRVDAGKLRAKRPVTFRAAPGATVVVDGDLTMQGSHGVFEGKRRRDGSYSLRARRVQSGIGASLKSVSTHVTFRQLKAETFAITGTRFITLEGGDYGPSVACWPRGKTGVGPLGGEITPVMWCPVGSGYEETGNTSGTEPRIGPSGSVKQSWPRNIVLDGVTVHDQNSLDYVNMHSGGLFLVSGRGLRIEDSLFYGNMVYDILAQDFTTADCCGMTYGPYEDVDIANNRFKAPVNAALQAGGNGWTSRVKNAMPELQLDPRNGRTWLNWRIERNSFENGIFFDGEPTFREVIVRRNVGGGGACFPGAAGLMWLDNVTSSSCGRASVPFGYVLRGGELRSAAGPTATVRRIFAAAARGVGALKIARGLERTPARTHSGWTAARVRRIVRDRHYLGGAFGPPRAHPRLVSPEEWRLAQQAIG